MLMSSIVDILHWIIYIGSLLSIALLFTKYYRWGAVYLGILFLTQAVFQGCIIVDLENYFRHSEGLPLLSNKMLTGSFTDNIEYQEILSYALALAAFFIASTEHDSRTL